MMEIERFEQAKRIREKIDHMNVKKLQLEKMKHRKDDEEFNIARELAYDGVCYVIEHMENDFKNL